jgi:glycine/D-amino acid oxidase-like deaminating enzyme
MSTETTLLRIRALNDAIRTHPYKGEIVVTPGISELPWHEQADILARVQTFDAFTEENDPHGEHDFGSFTHHGQSIYWKIDYYDLLLKYGADDPSDPARTRRVLTIMLAEEY